tara:strand:+ start:269 stop:541 length:273 start_codon:yes stop_codon:yes gene_type:complete
MAATGTTDDDRKRYSTPTKSDPKRFRQDLNKSICEMQGMDSADDKPETLHDIVMNSISEVLEASSSSHGQQSQNSTTKITTRATSKKFQP